VLLLVTLEIVVAEPVWLVPTPPPFSSLDILGRVVAYKGPCVLVA